MIHLWKVAYLSGHGYFSNKLSLKASLKFLVVHLKFSNILRIPMEILKGLIEVFIENVKV